MVYIANFVTVSLRKLLCTWQLSSLKHLTVSDYGLCASTCRHSWLLHLLVVGCRTRTEGEETGQGIQIERRQWERSHILLRPVGPPTAETCRNLYTTCTAVCATQNCRRRSTTCALELDKPIVGVVRHVASIHLNCAPSRLPLSNFCTSPHFFYLSVQPYDACFWNIWSEHVFPTTS